MEKLIENKMFGKVRAEYIEMVVNLQNNYKYIL